MATRIYTVTNAATGLPRMIRAQSPAQARSIAARDALAVHVTPIDEALALQRAGVEVEELADENAELKEYLSDCMTTALQQGAAS